MELHWAAKYIGVPYEIGGAEASGADCWGLVRWVLKAERGLLLPELSVRIADAENEANIKRCFSEWRRVDDYQEFDVVTMRNAFGHHVGIIARVQGGSADILHCDEPRSTVANLATMQLLGYRDFRSWRHER